MPASFLTPHITFSLVQKTVVIFFTASSFSSRFFAERTKYQFFGKNAIFSQARAEH